MENKIKEKLGGFKETYVITVIIGLIAHGICYLNFNSGHDAANLWWKSSVVGAAGGVRFLQPLLDSFFYDVRVPWLDGFLTLLFYSIAIWSTCETLEIKSKLHRYLLAGLFITSPTAIASNHFTGYVFAFALMTVCLSVYSFTHIKWGGRMAFFADFYNRWSICFIC